MLYSRGNNFVTSRLRFESGQNRCIVRFASARGENYLAIPLCSEKCANLLPRRPHGSSRCRAEIMHRRRVRILIPVDWQHRIHNERIGARCGIIVQINPSALHCYSRHGKSCQKASS